MCPAGPVRSVLSFVLRLLQNEQRALAPSLAATSWIAVYWSTDFSVRCGGLLAEKKVRREGGESSRRRRPRVVPHRRAVPPLVDAGAYRGTAAPGRAADPPSRLSRCLRTGTRILLGIPLGCCTTSIRSTSDNYPTPDPTVRSYPARSARSAKASPARPPRVRSHSLPLQTPVRKKAGEARLSISS